MKEGLNKVEDTAENNYGYVEDPANDVPGAMATASEQTEVKKEKFNIDPTSNLTAKGNERFNAISEAAKSRFSKISSGLGRFFKGAKELPKKVAVGVLSAPEVADHLNEKAATAMYKQYENAGNWVNETFGPTANAIYDSYENGKKFASEKGAQLADYTKSKVETFKAAGEAIKTKSVEGLAAAKQGISENAEKLWNIGKGAFDTARYAMMLLAEKRDAKKNKKRMKEIQDKLTETERLQKELAARQGMGAEHNSKIELYKKILNKNKTMNTVEMQYGKISGEALAA